VITDLPFNFVSFVCECVDPSISSVTMMAHWMEFGNFLLTLPCCVLFPQFMHRFLALFKTADRLRRGIISPTLCLSTLRETVQTFIEQQKKDPKTEEEDDDDDDEKEEAFEHCKTTIQALEVMKITIWGTSDGQSQKFALRAPLSRPPFRGASLMPY
jgi:hypothetical protein